jgi:hypothetical protein
VLHPKIKAAGGAATFVALLVAVLKLAGVDVTQDTQDTILLIVATALPVIAGYLKRADFS